MSGFICPMCGSKIDLSTRMKYVYCPVCTEKILSDDIKNGVLSQGLISQLNANEIDSVITDASLFSVDLLEAAANKGSVIACMELASRYVLKSNCVAAKKYFRTVAAKGIPDAEFGILVCDLDENDYDNNFHRLVERAKGFNQNSFRYLSQKTLNELNRIVDYKKAIWDLSYSFATVANTVNTPQPQPEVYYPVYQEPVKERSFTEGGPTGCGIGGSFCGCGSGR